jgi:hypothetical protein
MNGSTVAMMNAPATGGTTTAVTVAYPVGGAVLTAKTFDGANGIGTVLGQVTEEPLITMGQANIITLAIEGIARSATIAAAPNQPLLEGNAATGYTLLGDQPEAFDIILKDADNNVILDDPPPFVTLGNQAISAQYESGGASIIYFAATFQSSGYENITVQLNNPDGTTLDLSPVKIQDDPLVAVINGGTNSIAMYDGNGNTISLPVGSFSGLVHPTSLTYDPCLRLLVVADAGTNSLSFFGTDGETYPYSVGPFTGVSNPTALIAAPITGTYDYLVANAGDDSLRFYTTSGPTLLSPEFWSGHVPDGIACTNQCAQQILISSDNSATNLNQSLPPGAFAGLHDPSAILAAQFTNDSLVYIANRGNNTITTYTTSGATAATTGTFPGLSAPDAMTWNVEQSGLLVANAGNNSVTAYDLQGNAVPLPGGAFANLNAPSAILGIPLGQCYY